MNSNKKYIERMKSGKKISSRTDENFVVFAKWMMQVIKDGFFEDYVYICGDRSQRKFKINDIIPNGLFWSFQFYFAKKHGFITLDGPIIGRFFNDLGVAKTFNDSRIFDDETLKRLKEILGPVSQSYNDDDLKKLGKERGGCFCILNKNGVTEDELYRFF
jgi:hypothetical protein